MTTQRTKLECSTYDFIKMFTKQTKPCCLLEASVRTEASTLRADKLSGPDPWERRPQLGDNSRRAATTTDVTDPLATAFLFGYHKAQYLDPTAPSKSSNQCYSPGSNILHTKQGLTQGTRLCSFSDQVL